LKSFLTGLWESLRSNYWFVPALMTAGAIALSYGLLYLDQTLKTSSVSGLAWVYTGGASGARSVLSTVASSVITVAGTTFSITIAALSLASSQFGPRLLRGFLRDAGNQVVLGTFIGTFVYCLLVLRMVRGTQDDVFVPNLAVTGGVFLSLASVAALIYFINHVSTSIQAAHVVSSVTEELIEAIDRLYPAGIGQGVGDLDEVPPALSNPCHNIFATKSGYVQIVNQDKLIGLAQKVNGVLEIKRRPGAFVTRGCILAVLGAAGEPDEKFCKAVNSAFTVGPNRTMIQDAQFGLDQLVEVASRALSPGINDPFTAIMCLDRIGEALSELAARPMPSARRYDDKGALRVIAEPPTFQGMAEAALDQIRQYGSTSYAVTLRFLETLEAISPQVEDDDRAVLRRQATLAYEGRSALSASEDRQRVASRYAETVKALEAAPYPGPGSEAGKQ